MKLIFATNNHHKVRELQSLLHSDVELITLLQAGIDIDIPEPYDSLEENASIKARTIFELTGKDCFADDTGLEVKILDGEPGVKSARYAGVGASSQANIEKLLLKMNGKLVRTAQFRTVISVIIGGNETIFEGVCEGLITESVRGEAGFGYDPVFVPMGSHQTFSEMTLAEKNLYSHRAKASHKLVNFLNNLQTIH